MTTAASRRYERAELALVDGSAVEQHDIDDALTEMSAAARGMTREEVKLALRRRARRDFFIGAEEDVRVAS